MIPVNLSSFPFPFPFLFLFLCLCVIRWVKNPIITIVASCPGSEQCSGHGYCDTSTYTCQCSTGWSGGDCSQMACPTGLSWYSYPTADQEAHSDYAECSNMGICDPRFGTCTCRESFYGSACEYMACPSTSAGVCNGRGRCMTMAELALWAQDNGDATDYTYGDDPNNFLTWYERTPSLHTSFPRDE
jgi:hypothetical protein